MAGGCIAHCPTSRKRLGDLLVQFHTVGDDHERPIAGNLAQHLLRKEHHRKALAGTLRLPEHTAATMAFLACFEHRANRVVHADELMVLPDDLGQSTLVLGEQRVVLCQIEQA